jgi:hypothetical protein
MEPDRIFACEEPLILGQPCSEPGGEEAAIALNEKKDALFSAMAKLDPQARRALCLVSEIWIGSLPDRAWGAADKVAFSAEGWGQYHLYLNPRIFDQATMSSWLLLLDKERWQFKEPPSYEYVVEMGEPLLHLLHHELGHIMDDHLHLAQGKACNYSDCEPDEASFVAQHWQTFSEPKNSRAQDLQVAFCLDPQQKCFAPPPSSEAVFPLFQSLAQTNFPSPYSLSNAREFAAEAFAWHALQQQSEHSSYQVIQQGEAIEVGFDLGISSWID